MFLGSLLVILLGVNLLGGSLLGMSLLGVSLLGGSLLGVDFLDLFGSSWGVSDDSWGSNWCGGCGFLVSVVSRFVSVVSFCDFLCDDFGHFIKISIQIRFIR